MNQLDRLFNQFYDNALEETFKAVGPVERKLTLKSSLLELLGDFSYLDETRVEMKPTVIETKEFDDYTRELISLPVTDLIYIPIYVLTPKTEQQIYSSVLALHGHGYGVKEAVGLTKSGEQEQGEPGIHNQFAVELVKRGLKVFAPEVIGFGERRLTRDKEAGNINSCEAMATNLLMEGKTLAGLRIWEARRLLDYMESCSDVNTSRIGMMGFSGGAVITTYTAALDLRVSTTVLTGFTNTFKGSIMAMHHCIDNYIPGILNYAELPEWISLISPRSLFIESGEKDPIFPNQYVKEAIAEIEKYYDNRPEKFAYDIFPGVHEISGRKSFDWLKRQLLPS
ncbi:dienelactone hydrolase [Gracilibacillus salitolerans]|uniref:Dienelactone hydrolase n=1 Tax=Gracilibacillus salitolerans TaxID=2663022 RepID=A0A5Q2TIX9_9BACI|nr:alpha/beta hydrolase family protein [Gracilibacillus salitolerans]QGH34002.1 dienelactone hydrolase [Gracilibacillus salitolerans]